MITDLPPRGDQPEAIAGLTESIRAGHRFQTLLGVTGSGKSVVAQTPVLLKQGDRVVLEMIGPFIDRMMTSRSQEMRSRGDTEVLEETGTTDRVEALSFDPRTAAVSWKPIRQFLRHRSPNILWEITTACGRTVTVTGDHNFFVLRKGRLQLLPTEDLRPDDYLPVPRSLPEPSQSITELSVAEMLSDDAQVYVSVPRFSEIWATTAALRPLLPLNRARGLLRQERMPLGLYRRLVAESPGLSVGARFGTRLRRHDLAGKLPISADLLRFIGY
ncbi:MAG: hypothetical protein ACREXY_25940, partial [Gammaproteobacteria bacterium]